MDGLKKYRARVTAIAAVAALVLIGCSSDGNNEGKNPANEQAPSAAGFPVTIEHKFGSTKIADKPERVVAVGWNDQDIALALGITPVSARAWFDEYNSFPWVQDATDGKGVPTFSGELDFEAILAQRPDVILAIYETITKETYDKLTQIAPTIIQSADYPDEQTPWDVQTLTTGKALGKAAEAQALVDQVNSKIDEAKAAHPEFAGKTLVVDYGPGTGEHFLIPRDDPRRALFDALGFDAQAESEELAEERLDVIDRDVLFVNGATKEDLMKSPVFARLDVVTSDRTIYTTFDTPLAGALSYSGPKALLYALDVLVPQLAKAVDGDPATKVDDLTGSG